MEIRKLITENWPIKAVSLILSVTIWFYVTSKGKTELSLTVPLELRNVPEAMAVVGDVPGTIEVRLQGQERSLRDLAVAKTVIGTVDLGRGREGDNRFHLSPDDIRRPPGVTVTHLAPSEIAVRLEPVIQRTVRIQPVITGNPQPGYRLLGTSIKPGRVTIEGPASVVRLFPSLQTLPIDITGARNTLTVDPRIDYRGRPVRILEQGISVTVTIQKERS